MSGYSTSTFDINIEPETVTTGWFKLHVTNYLTYCIVNVGGMAWARCKGGVSDTLHS